MNTSIIEKREVYNLFQDLNGVSSFSKKIFLNFIPDELVVRYVNYFSAAGGEGNVTMLASDLVGGNLCSFSDISFISCDTHYPINKPIYSVYNFQLLNSAGNLINTRTGSLAVGLEFVKYKDVQQEKIY